MEEEKYTQLLTYDIIKSFNTEKGNITKYIQKNFKKNEDYIIFKPNLSKKGGSGKLKLDYKMTEEAYNLLKNSYKLRQVQLTKKSLTHPILISIETASISFICDVFRDFNIIKQYKVDKYLIDLYFVDYNLAVECDEERHDEYKDKLREENIKNKINCKFYRYKPNKDTFILSNVIYDLMKIIMV